MLGGQKAGINKSIPDDLPSQIRSNDGKTEKD
jgi:hypothetical protein